MQPPSATDAGDGAIWLRIALPEVISKAKERPIPKAPRDTKARDTQATKREELKEEVIRRGGKEEATQERQDTKEQGTEGRQDTKERDTSQDGKEEVKQELKEVSCQSPSATATPVEVEGTSLKTAPKPLMKWAKGGKLTEAKEPPKRRPSGSLNRRGSTASSQIPRP